MPLVYLRGEAQVVLQLVEPPLMYASTMGACSIFANHSPGKFARFLVLRHVARCVTTPPAMETVTLHEIQRIFQRRNDSTVIKARWSLSAKNCNWNGSELTPIHSQLR